MSTLVDAAAALARQAHAGQLRKGGGEPYFSHLESVARRLAAAGVSDEATLAAAYLHDLLEDQPAHEAALRSEFPAEVVTTVELCSERKLDERGAKRPKQERVHDYLAALAARGLAAARACQVSCADKIDNLESLLVSERRGDQLLVTLSTRPGQHLPHLALLRAVYAPVVPAALLAAFDDATARFAAFLRGWLPGRAIALAAAAHLGQLDRAGAPYILHPLRLMMRASTDAERMVAVMHDVVEDTVWTLEALAAEGFPPEVLGALACLTKRAGEDYPSFITRVLEDPLATRVKLWDLEDNLDSRRLPTLEPRDLERLAKYHTARARILARLSE